MLERTVTELTKKITTAIADNEEKVWVYMGNGYVLDQDALKKVIRTAIIDTVAVSRV